MTARRGGEMIPFVFAFGVLYLAVVQNSAKWNDERMKMKNGSWKHPVISERTRLVPMVNPRQPARAAMPARE